MNVTYEERIEKETYRKLKSWGESPFYLSKDWHRTLEDIFHQPVGGISVCDNDELLGFVPVMARRRLNLKKFLHGLPLSHSVQPLLKCAEAGIKLSKYISEFEIPVEVHGEIDGLSQKVRNFNSTLDLRIFNNAEEYFKSLDYKSCRYMINRSKRDGIEISSAFTLENFNHFYNLELETRHRLGSPMYPASFFKLLFETYRASDSLQIKIAFLEGRPVAGIIMFISDNKMTYGYGATVSDPKVKKIGANEGIVFDAISDAIGDGFEEFEFGTTPCELKGLLKFKEKFGATSVPLIYSSNRPFAGAIDRGGLAVKYGSEIFKKMPLSLFKWSSPMVLRKVI